MLSAVAAPSPSRPSLRCSTRGSRGRPRGRARSRRWGSRTRPPAGGCFPAPARHAALHQIDQLTAALENASRRRMDLQGNNVRQAECRRSLDAFTWQHGRLRSQIMPQALQDARFCQGTRCRKTCPLCYRNFGVRCNPPTQHDLHHCHNGIASSTLSKGRSGRDSSTVLARSTEGRLNIASYASKSSLIDAALVFAVADSVPVAR